MLTRLDFLEGFSELQRAEGGEARAREPARGHEQRGEDVAATGRRDPHPRRRALGHLDQRQGAPGVCRQQRRGHARSWSGRRSEPPLPWARRARWDPGSVLRGRNGTPDGVACDVRVASTKDLFELNRLQVPAGAPAPAPLPSPGGLPPGPLSIVIEGPRLDQPIDWPLTSDGALYLDPRRFVEQEATPLSMMWSSVGTGAPDTAWLGTLWRYLLVVLGPEEDRVTDAASASSNRTSSGSPSCPAPPAASSSSWQASAGRVPLRSMGEGMQRLLSLALHLVRAAHSYLLVDDIDTGLHHSVMKAMWRMVIETARRLDVQVLATTHSLDSASTRWGWPTIRPRRTCSCTASIRVTGRRRHDLHGGRDRRRRRAPDGGSG